MHHDDDEDDDGGITGWQQGDADQQLVEDGGVTIDDDALARFGRMAMIAAMVMLVVYMARQYLGG
jgi:hypothetical protein